MTTLLVASLLALAALLPAGAVRAQAQPAPDTGQILRETRPPPVRTPPQPSPLPAAPASPPPAGAQAPSVSFKLERVAFRGNTVVPTEVLEGLVADRVGTQVRFDDLEELARRVTEHYRAAGYFLARALLPQQTVRGGVVEMSVIEGRLARVRLEQAPQTPVPKVLVQRMLERLPVGQPLRQQQLERAMLVLADVPGLVAQSSLEQGEEPGTTDLIVEVRPSRRWDLSLDADDFGSRAVGEYRLGALGRIRSPLGLGDNLDLRLLRSTNGNLEFGRVGWEAPVGAAGTRAGIAFSSLRYALGGDFAALRGSGDADILDLALLHPLVRSRSQNLVLRGGVSLKRLDDRLEAVELRSRKALQTANLGLTYEARDALLGGGYSSATLIGYAGELDLRSAQARELDRGPGGRQAEGRFARATYQLSRLQSLTPRTSAFVGLSGQFASGNLDSAEKIALGGPTAVRAYPVSEAIVDEGHLVNAEYRVLVAPNASASAFYDAGWGRTSRFPAPGEANRRTLRGFGVGLFWQAPAGFTVRASLAWRDTGAPQSERTDRNPRLFAQVIKTF